MIADAVSDLSAVYTLGDACVGAVVTDKNDPLGLKL
jgi:hypothetical protein